MAEPSDLIGEVAGVAAEADIPKHIGPIHRNLDDVREKKYAARRVEALSLRLAGLTYEQIGERLGISTQGAIDLVNRTLSRAENLAVQQLRELESARLDRAQAAIWTQVLEGDLRAVDVFLRLSKRRSLLLGLDAPTEININVGIRDEMEAALGELEKVILGTVVRSHYESDGTTAIES